jgi:alkylation response protein AidB-like acyl-CoA dehydrogenase
MQFGLAEEQEALRDAVAGFLEQHGTVADVRALIDSELGFDAKVWERACRELGLAGIAIAEQFGGAGSSVVSLGVVLRELGRTLSAFPFLSSVVLAGTALQQLATVEFQEQFLPGIASGELIATTAVCEPVGGWNIDATELTVSKENRLTGVKCAVLDAQLADVLLVVARNDAGLALFAVDRQAPGIELIREDTMDLTRRQFTVRFTETPAQLVSGDTDASGAIQLVLDIAAAALAAEQVGGAERVLEMAVEYAKVREQFGRSIGSFQVIKHMCAELVVQTEGACTAALYALWTADTQVEELAFSARAAGAVCAETFSAAAAANIQIHGGIGFTWEHPAHLYLRRARTSEALFGTPEEQRAQLLAAALR